MNLVGLLENMNNMSQIEFEDQINTKPTDVVLKNNRECSCMIRMLISLKLAKTTKTAIRELIVLSIIMLCIAVYFFTHSSPSVPQNNIQYMSADGLIIIRQ